MKKKMIILLVSMVLTLAACGNTETTNEPESMEVSVESESGESIESVESSVEESSEEEFSEEESTDLSAYVMEPEEYSYKVNISINPQLTLYAGKNEEGEDIVLAWTFDNEDAEEVYKDTDFHDMSVLDAVKEVILVAAEKEYLKEDGTVEIDIVSDTEEIPEDIVKMYEEAANAVIKEKELKNEIKVTRNGEELKVEEEQEKEVAESKENDKTSTKETPAPSEDKKTASNTNTSTATPAPTQAQASAVTPAPTATPVTTPAPAATPEPTQAPQEEQPAEEEQPTENVMEEQVTATDTVNVRSSDSENADRIGQVAMGETVTRYEAKENGWSRISYNGGDGYVKSEYLQAAGTTDASTEQPQEETSTDDSQTETAGTTSLTAKGKVTIKETVNVRKSSSETSDKIGVAYQGEHYDLIMEQADGWCKISFNGQTGYVKTEFVE